MNLVLAPEPVRMLPRGLHPVFRVTRIPDEFFHVPDEEETKDDGKDEAGEGGEEGQGKARASAASSAAAAAAKASGEAPSKRAAAAEAKARLAEQKREEKARAQAQKEQEKEEKKQATADERARKAAAALAGGGGGGGRKRKAVELQPSAIVPADAVADAAEAAHAEGEEGGEMEDAGEGREDREPSAKRHAAGGSMRHAPSVELLSPVEPVRSEEALRALADRLSQCIGDDEREYVRDYFTLNTREREDLAALVAKEERETPARLLAAARAVAASAASSGACEPRQEGILPAIARAAVVAERRGSSREGAAAATGSWEEMAAAQQRAMKALGVGPADDKPHPLLLRLRRAPPPPPAASSAAAAAAEGPDKASPLPTKPAPRKRPAKRPLLPLPPHPQQQVGGGSGASTSGDVASPVPAPSDAAAEGEEEVALGGAGLLSRSPAAPSAPARKKPRAAAGKAASKRGGEAKPPLPPPRSSAPTAGPINADAAAAAAAAAAAPLAPVASQDDAEGPALHLLDPLRLRAALIGGRGATRSSARIASAAGRPAPSPAPTAHPIDVANRDALLDKVPHPPPPREALVLEDVWSPHRARRVGGQLVAALSAHERVRRPPPASPAAAGGAEISDDVDVDVTVVASGAHDEDASFLEALAREHRQQQEQQQQEPSSSQQLPFPPSQVLSDSLRFQGGGSQSTVGRLGSFASVSQAGAGLSQLSVELSQAAVPASTAPPAPSASLHVADPLRAALLPSLLVKAPQQAPDLAGTLVGLRLPCMPPNPLRRRLPAPLFVSGAPTH